MLQVIRLVSPGRVDRMLAFDELPKRFLSGVRKRDESATRGLRDFLRKSGCVEKKISKVQLEEKGKFEEIEFEFPFTYYLEYQAVNADKEKWIDIVSYTRRVVDPSVRLMDKFEDISKPCAPDSYSEFELEGQDIPVIPIKPEIITAKVYPKVVESPVVEKAEEEAEEVVVQEILKKKRGRPRKVATEV